MKQAEHLSLRWRLQKGDPQRALQVERAGLSTLGRMGLPVARLVAAGPGFLATAAAGEPVAEMFATHGATAEAPLAALSAAGTALAVMHGAGVAHGRPALRDACWDGHRVRFIDLEHYQPGPAAPGRMARDLLVLLHSVMLMRVEPGPELAATLAGWRAQAPPGLWDEVRRQAERLQRLRGVARVAMRLRPPAPEVAAAVALLDWLAAGGDAAP